MKKKYKFKLTFFIPCLNEEKNIVSTLNNITYVIEKSKINSEIIIVDDNSSDKTVLEVENYENKSNLKINLIKNSSTKGLGLNYVDAAFKAEGEYYMLVNGDNAEPKESILSIVSLIGQADMIIPYFKNDDTRSFWRVLISKIFTFIINLISNQNIPYYNGPVLHKTYNVMRWSPDTHGYAYQAELITRILDEGVSYKTILIKNSNRNFGSSSAFSFKNILSVIHSILQIFLRRLRKLIFYRNKN
tara:strand:+ start:14442 stop:15176 length:735 start_codon:yes stop_codon:yes gene_type:complete